MRKKSPFLAAVLSFVFGPFGYLYIGWRYALLAVGVFFIFGLIVNIADFPVHSWAPLITLSALAWESWSITLIRNDLIESGEESTPSFNTWRFATAAMSSLIMRMGIPYAAALGLYSGMVLVLKGSVLKGVTVAIFGTAVLVFAATLLFGLIAAVMFVMATKDSEH